MIVSEDALRSLSPLALAHMGDGVYELLVRRELCRKGLLTAANLHRATVQYVSAGAQAKAVKGLFEHLTEQEMAVFRRGRNCKSHVAPHAVTEGEYHAATGLEALFGWLYLREDNARIEELFMILWENANATGCSSAAGTEK